MAAADVSPSEEAIQGPIKARGGKTFEILDEGLRVTSRNGFFSKPTVQTTSWDDFRRCDVETSCFSGVISLAQADGDKVSLKVPLARVQSIAVAMYKKLNLGKHGQVEPAVTKLLGKRPRALIFGSGLVLSRSRGLCGSTSTFVPWEAVVSLSLRPGCFGSCVEVTTLVEEQPKPPSGPSQSPEVAPAGEEEKPDGEPNEEDDKASTGPGHLKVTIKTKAEASETIFAALQKLMNCGAAPEPLPGTAKVPGAEMTTLGLRIKQRRHQTLFLPWSSIAAVDLQSVFFKDRLVLTDCIGSQAVLRSLAPGEFDTVRAQIAKAKGAQGPSAATAFKPIVRRNLRLTADGVTLIQRRLCSADSQFIPWPKLDALEMQTTCSGGTLLLITETGQRIQVCRAGMFGKKSMNEIASRIQDMKYGKPGHEKIRTFAGREGDRRACVLTDRSVRLTAARGRVVRVVDLDSVNSCEVAAGGRKLLVSLRESMAIDGDDVKEGVQPLEVSLRRGEDAQDIAADVMRRAMARKSGA